MSATLKAQNILPLSFVVSDLDLTIIQMVKEHPGVPRGIIAEKISEMHSTTLGKANDIITALQYNGILTIRGQMLYTDKILGIDGKTVSVGGAI
jgi:predicted transcriptional regulator YheO